MDCHCGCGGISPTGSHFLPGHDENVRAAVMYLITGLPRHGTKKLAEIFGFGPGGRNAEQMCRDMRTNAQ